MSKPVLGAQLYTVRKYTQTIKDVASTFKKVKDIGYTAVQISAFGPLDPKEVAKVVADSGLTVACTHVAWSQFLEDLDTVIETHKLWNCVHPAIGSLPQEYRGAEGLKRFLDELPPVAEKLADEGMDFSYHNHAHEFVRINGKTWLAALFEQADPRHLKAELDTHWIQVGGGDPAEWIRTCAGREPLLHLKDFIITADNERRFGEIGEGNLNWPAIIQAAKEGGVQWYLIEQDDCYGRDEFESLAISYRNLKEMGLS